MNKFHSIGLLVIGSLLVETAHAERIRKPKEQNRLVQVVTENSPYLGGGLVGTVLAGVGLIGKQVTEKKVAEQIKTLAANEKALQEFEKLIKESSEKLSAASQKVTVLQAHHTTQYNSLLGAFKEYPFPYAKEDIFKKVVEGKSLSVICDEFKAGLNANLNNRAKHENRKQLEKFLKKYMHDNQQKIKDYYSCGSEIKATAAQHSSLNTQQPAPTIDLAQVVARDKALKNARTFSYLMYAGAATILAAGVTWAVFELVRHYKEKKSSEKKSSIITI